LINAEVVFTGNARNNPMAAQPVPDNHLQSNSISSGIVHLKSAAASVGARV